MILFWLLKYVRIAGSGDASQNEGSLLLWKYVLNIQKARKTCNSYENQNYWLRDDYNVNEPITY